PDKFRGIIISPGPGAPCDAGVSIDVVKAFTGRLPILGVCLGHQSIGAAFGGNVGRTVPLHGKSSDVEHDGSGIFQGVESPFEAGRYHSLHVEFDAIPQELEVTARSLDGIVMGLKHREHPTYGLQFHPESVLTPGGQRILANFLVECGEIATAEGDAE
ncbi:MAG: aminodeoxychorismate/anthranilate synthase component II, partial [Planctomycetota bacterium]